MRDNGEKLGKNWGIADNLPFKNELRAPKTIARQQDASKSL